MRNIRCVLFDLGWTLLKPASGDWTYTCAFQKMFPQEICGSYSEKRWCDAFAKAYQPLADAPYMKDVEEQICRYTRFFHELVQYAGYEITNEQAKVLAEDISCNDRNMYLLHTAEETLIRLKKEGYRLGVISDTWPNIETQLAYLGIDGYFDQLTYSYRLGVSKPDPAMFEDAIKKSGMRPDEILFIDDLAKNLYAAEKQGMHCLLSLAHPGIEKDPHFGHVYRPDDVFAYLKEE